jgi:hypothetical protein
VSEVRERAPAPILDLFATAVHRFGSAWADLVAATVALMALAALPTVIVHKTGGSLRATITTAEVAGAIAYFMLLAVVVLRGLPTSPPRSRILGSAVAAVITGLLAFALIRLLGPLAILPMPLLLLAVPAVAAGDRGVLRAFPAGAWLAVRHFSRTWGVWLLAILFSTPIWVSIALVVLNFSVGATQFVLTFTLAAPIIWPFSALFIRALYGDLTGRLVVAPEDRSR